MLEARGGMLEAVRFSSTEGLAWPRQDGRRGDRGVFCCCPTFLAPAVCPLSLISGLHPHLAPRAAPRAVGGTGDAEPCVSKFL